MITAAGRVASRRWLPLLVLAAEAVGARGVTLSYEGSFAPPHFPRPEVRYGYGMKGMTYAPDCVGNPDPSAEDGFPGCLIATTHPDFDRAGVFDIPEPEKVAVEDRSRDYWIEQLTHAAPVVEFFDPSGGIKQVIDEEPGWKARDIPGIVLIDGDLISTCGHDWYNAARTDHASHCWAKLASDGRVMEAIGAYNLGSRKSPNDLYHADSMSHYIGVVGRQFADLHLGASGRRLCFSARQRPGGGAPGRSQGPTLFVHQCSRPHVEPPGWLESTALLYYRPKYPLSLAASDHPEYSPTSQCFDAGWVEQDDARGVLFSCQQGGPIWWYGFADPWSEPGNDGQLVNHRNLCFWNQGEARDKQGAPCKTEFLKHGPLIPCYEHGDAGECTRGLTDRCRESKGYHGVFEDDPQMHARVLWYSEEGLAEVAKGTRKPWTVPFEVVLDQPDEMWPACQGSFGGMAIDPERGLLYIAQINRGEFPVIHTYRIRGEASGAESPP